MGHVVARRFVVQVDGAIASLPYGDFDAALEMAGTFSSTVRVTINCYWSGHELWVNKQRKARLISA